MHFSDILPCTVVDPDSALQMGAGWNILSRRRELMPFHSYWQPSTGQCLAKNKVIFCNSLKPEFSRQFRDWLQEGDGPITEDFHLCVSQSEMFIVVSANESARIVRQYKRSKMDGNCSDGAATCLTSLPDNATCLFLCVYLLREENDWKCHLNSFTWQKSSTMLLGKSVPAKHALYLLFLSSKIFAYL